MAPQPTIAECDAIITAKGSPFEITTVEINGLTYKTWLHAPPHWRAFLDIKLEEYADKEFISSPLAPPAPQTARETVTYGEVHRRAVRLAAWLKGQGVGLGTRVAVGGSNSIEWVVAFLAVHLLGGVPVLLNGTLTSKPQIHCLQIAQPKITLVDEHVASIIGVHKAEMKRRGITNLYCWSSTDHLPRKARLPELGEINPDPKLIEAVERGEGLEGLGPESDATIFFTSGTTGLPKGVLSTQRASMHSVLTNFTPTLRDGLRQGGDLRTMLTTPYPVTPTMLISIPFFHVTGCLGWLVRAIGSGFKLVFMRRWSTRVVLDLIKAEKVNVIGGVPAIVTAILQSPLLPKDTEMLSVNYGGAPPPERLPGDLTRRWPNSAISHGYGMTETNAMHMAVNGQDYIQRPTTVGVPTPISEVKIVDPETRKELPTGQMGLLLARGVNIMKEYVGDPKATANALDKDGWLDTGDVAIVDSDGFVHITDRMKDIIFRGGENIPSVEVENAVYDDKRIAEAAAVPVPDHRLGELVGVAVSLAPGATATEADLLATVKPKLRYPAQPVIIYVSNEPLPRNANGKPVKLDIKKIVVKEYLARQRQSKL
ncbi:3-[(3aS,4S,7aS)-7a-methyl-1,5-dioxo-octahydro-1H-inden-4-yl]propanoyl:CoA ligase [Vanrija pseudolonga]|uniref:3-[(3aS,4S,7aS)-7a-methyl-1, 5-dioxo-octahydro-1H-inden-4-yl]propanoyl:CoA ligase n=1 Tax=Vanrija pseudolonga TaxID=143232 RepID=A0AAF1BF67_9TREE|nr:3-[(3aS,4S,7aS)-7a-methyl-1,5-dioxo-octahydro-1H-inden-4-yl]propanoyl:CoA ligase [Vanrija pseudolonga]